MVTILDRAVDREQFRRRMANAVAKVPRLREKVVSGLGRLSPPTWRTDPEFDFDYHVRHIRLPAPGTDEQLYQLATRMYEDPFDRTRPLWLFVTIDGLAGGRGALFWKMHHSITDGIGAVRLSELYMERERDADVPPEVDLTEAIQAALGGRGGRGGSRRGENGRGLGWAHGGPPVAPPDGHRPAHRRRGGDLVGRAAPGPRRRRATCSTTARSALDQLGASNEVPGGSPLWRNRSRRRHLESLRVPLEAAKAAGKALGGSVNDVFVAGAVNGALAVPRAAGRGGRRPQHQLRGQHPDRQGHRRQLVLADARPGARSAR